MPREIFSNEANALRAAEMVLRFAAENGKALPLADVATVCRALDAKAAHAWDEAVATEFWCSFNRLCEIVKPATVDTLTIHYSAVPFPRWMFWRREAEPVSSSRHTAGKFLFWLMVLLSLSVLLGVVVSTATGLVNDIKGLMKQSDELNEELRTSANKLDGVFNRRTFDSADENEKVEVAALQALLNRHASVSDEMLQRSVLVSKEVQGHP